MIPQRISLCSLSFVSWTKNTSTEVSLVGPRFLVGHLLEAKRRGAWMGLHQAPPADKNLGGGVDKEVRPPVVSVTRGQTAMIEL